MQTIYPEIWDKLLKMGYQCTLCSETRALSIFLEKKELIAYTDCSKKDVDNGQNQNSIKEYSQLL